MKILCIVQRYYPVIGGAENLMKSIMDYLSKNHEVTVYTTTAKDIEAFWDPTAETINEENLLNYPLKRFKIATPTEIKFDNDINSFYIASSHPGPFCPGLWQELVFKKIDYDLIIAASYPYDHIIPAYVAAKKWNIPLIIYPMIHQEFVELFLNSIKLTMLENSNAVIVNTLSEKRILVELGITENKISQNYPITHTIEINQSDPESFRKEFLPKQDANMVLFAGSKSMVKGIIHLIESMKEVWNKIPNTYLVMMGPSTKEFDNYFRKLSTKTKSKIIDLGTANEQTKKNAFAACDVFTLPSKSESFGIVYVEAWTFEKPVIGCNIISTCEVIDDKTNGLLVEFGNIKQLSKSIEFLLENPSIREEYGKQGKKKALSYTSKDNLKSFEEKCFTVVESFKNMKSL
ncbi:MAG: glycosyltransferase family 4 protein [Nitrosarchaeum sp.]